jgi:hypothetical protein
MASQRKTDYIFEIGDLALLGPLALPVLILESVRPEDTFAKVLYDKLTIYVETYRLIVDEEKNEDI